MEIVGNNGAAVSTLADFPPTPGRAVTTTIDPTVQKGAERPS